MSTLSRLRAITARLATPTLRALLIVGGLGIAGKAAAFGRELVVASRFGAGLSLDAFIIATIIPTLVTNVIGYVLGATILTALLKVRRDQGPAVEAEAQRRVLFWGGLLIAGIATAASAAAPWVLPWLSPGFTTSSRDVTLTLLWVATPYGILSAMNRVLAILAESEGRFAFTSAGPIVIALVATAVLLGVREATPAVLVGGLTLGTIAELVLLIQALRGTRYHWRPRIARWTPMETGILAIMAPTLLGSFLHSLTLVVDQSMASLAGPGKVAEFMYGGRLVAVLIGIVGTPLMQLSFPQFARLLAEHRLEDFSNTLRRFAYFSLLLSVPLMVVLSAGSEWIVDATFQRGKFTPETAERVALIQALSALQIPFAILGMLGLRAVYALNVGRVMLIHGAVTVVLNAVLDVVLLRWLGVPGLALGTTIIAIGTSAFVFAVVRHRIRCERAKLFPAAAVELRRAA